MDGNRLRLSVEAEWVAPFRLPADPIGEGRQPVVHLFFEGGPPYAPEEGGDRPFPNFDGLAFAIEELMLTRPAPWPMETFWELRS